MFSSFLLFCFISGLSVVPTELVIHWNNIQGVNQLDTVSQLLPFILGLGQFIDVLYRSYKKSRHGQEEAAEGDDEAEAEGTINLS